MAKLVTYESLLRERIDTRIDDLYRLDGYMFLGWDGWHSTVDTLGISLQTLEQLCVELACQMFAFSSRRASHLPILSAFRDREECEREERAILARIKAGCEEEA